MIFSKNPSLLLKTIFPSESSSNESTNLHQLFLFFFSSFFFFLLDTSSDFLYVNNGQWFEIYSKKLYKIIFTMISCYSTSHITRVSVRNEICSKTDGKFFTTLYLQSYSTTHQ